MYGWWLYDIPHNLHLCILYSSLHTYAIHYIHTHAGGFVLTHPSYTTNVTEFIATCCNFHGCQKRDIIQYSHFCRDNYDYILSTYILNKSIIGSKRWSTPPRINHYSRSLEKYVLKSKTWETASGEGQNYDEIVWVYDDMRIWYCCMTVCYTYIARA